MAEIRIHELKSLQENLQKEITRMKEEIAVFDCKLKLLATGCSLFCIKIIRLRKHWK